jgi:hypothetical protein
MPLNVEAVMVEPIQADVENVEFIVKVVWKP